MQFFEHRERIERTSRLNFSLIFPRHPADDILLSFRGKKKKADCISTCLLWHQEIPQRRGTQSVQCQSANQRSPLCSNYHVSQLRDTCHHFTSLLSRPQPHPICQSWLKLVPNLFGGLASRPRLRVGASHVTERRMDVRLNIKSGWPAALMRVIAT